MDGTNGIGVADGLAYQRVTWNTNIPTDALGIYGNVSPGLQIGPLQDTAGTTSRDCLRNAFTCSVMDRITFTSVERVNSGRDCGNIP
jgi:hypothetical protein